MTKILSIIFSAIMAILSIFGINPKPVDPVEPVFPVDFDTAKIIEYYNDTTRKAFENKVEFYKERTTMERKYEAGAALRPFKSVIHKFMGIGNDNKFTENISDAAKLNNYQKYLIASSLTESDIEQIVMKESGGNYVISVKIKDGSTAVEGGKVTKNDKTPLDRSGLSNGCDDKTYWDHKTAQNIYSAIDDVPGCGKATIKESYTDAQITMTVTKTGDLLQLAAKFTFHVDISGVMGSSVVAEATSIVIMKDFKW